MRHPDLCDCPTCESDCKLVPARRIRAGDTLRFLGQDEVVDRVEHHPKHRNIMHIYLKGIKSPLVENASASVERVG